MDFAYLGALLSASKQLNKPTIIKDHTLGISDIAVSPYDETEFIAASFDQTLTIYDINSQSRTLTLNGHTAGVWTTEYSPSDKNTIISAGNDNTIRLWDKSNGKNINTIKLHKNAIYDVQYSTDGKKFACCSKELISVWDVNNLKSPYDIIENDSSDYDKSFIYCLNFINNNDTIITGYMDGNVLIHDLKEPETDSRTLVLPDYINKYKEEESYSKSVFSLTKFNKSDNKIILCHSDGSVKIFDIEGKLIKEKDAFFYFTSPVTCANVSSDDKTIVACGKDRTAEVWDLNTHKEIKYTLSGHKGVITTCHFVDNGKKNIVITGSYDNSIRIWNLN
jgi:WD40 repeat protein